MKLWKIGVPCVLVIVSLAIALTRASGSAGGSGTDAPSPGNEVWATRLTSLTREYADGALPDTSIAAVDAAAGNPTAPAVQGESSGSWQATYKQVRVAPSVVFRHAPLSATVEKLVRNKHLNPNDRPMSGAEIALLRSVVDRFHDLIRKVEHEKGLIRTDVMMKKLRDGGLTPLSQMTSCLDASEMQRIGDRVSAVGDQGERDSKTRQLVKEAVMKKLGLESAMTTPSGEVLFAPAGSVDAAMPDHLQFQRFLQDEFMMNVVTFFFAGGYIDSGTRDNIISVYFRG